MVPVAIALPIVAGMHNAGCVPTQADPASTMVFDIGDDRYYIECRHSPFHGPPLSKCVHGDMWLYREANDVDGLQRGGIGLGGGCLPPQPFPCLIIDEDPINDEHCGHGPDEVII